MLNRPSSKGPQSPKKVTSTVQECMHSSSSSFNNDEWPEIIDTSLIGTTQHIKVKPPSISRSATSSPPSHSVDLEHVTSNDLALLKTNDPFLYYSIPGIRNAAMYMKEINVEDIRTEAVNTERRRKCYSCPSRIETVQTKKPEEEEFNSSSKVTRSTCLSYEAFPDSDCFHDCDGLSMVLDELLLESDNEEEEEEEEDDLEKLLTLIQQQKWSVVYI